MNKKLVMWFLIGWAASIVYSPKHLTAMFSKKG